MKTGDQQFTDEPAVPAANDGSAPTDRESAPADQGSTPADHPFAAIEATFKRAVAALDAADIPFLLGGSLACWAHGGAETRKISI